MATVFRSRRMLAFVLIACMCLTIAPTATAELNFEDYCYRLTLDGMFSAYQDALDDGFSPEEAGEALYAYADENELLDALLYCVENAAAYETERYHLILNSCDGESFSHSMYLYNPSDYTSLDSKYDVYACPSVPDELLSVLGSSNAEYCFDPYFWPEASFKTVLGTAFDRFKPASPRPGYVCVVLAANAQTFPKTKWSDNDENESVLTDALETTVQTVLDSLDEEAPVITGNPNLASEFWVFDLQFSYYARYGTDVSGYNSTVSLTVLDAAKHSTIAKISAYNQLPDRIGRWRNYTAWADAADISMLSQYESFIASVNSALSKERAAAQANRKLTQLNCASVLNSKLLDLAGQAGDAWQRAIYEAGAEYVSMQGDTLTFKLRSFDPLLSSLGSYKKAEDPDEWLLSALRNASEYTLDVSVTLKDGQITEDGLAVIRRAIRKAASSSKTAFGNEDFKKALFAYLFPAVTDTDVKSASDLLTPSERFSESFPVSCADTYADRLAALFHAQKRQTLDVNNGPRALTLSCTGVDPVSMLEEARKDVMDREAYLPWGERAFGDELETLFKTTLAEKAISAKKNGQYRFNVTVDIDTLLADRLPGEYRQYVESFDFNGVNSRLVEDVENLPDEAAQPFPGNGVLSGAKSGVKVTIQLSRNSDYTYVQLRTADTNEKAASAFVHPGKSVTMRVPGGEYFIVWACGDYWYGEENLFGYDSYMQKSEVTSLDSNCSFTLEAVDNGDISVYGADMSDFQ